MKNLRIVTTVLALIGLAEVGFAQPTIKEKPMISKPHPRILLLKGEEVQIQQAMGREPALKKMHEAIRQECDSLLLLPPVERELIGSRLLDKSREAIRRIFSLAYVWRMTGEDKYFVRCENEMLAICQFSDWNPSHFLDVAEMTMGVSIGYDWLYPKLSAESRKIIREAIVSKGLTPSLDTNAMWWLKRNNNWNQICNAGMTYGALAVAEDYPDLAKSLIERAVTSITAGMSVYKPDGVYPEGYFYWEYGTMFNVMFLSALEKGLDDDNGLSQMLGFLKTPEFRLHMTSNTKLSFNWSDCIDRGALSPSMFWFAQRTGDPTLLWAEKQYLQREDYSTFIHTPHNEGRFLPAVMVWGKDLRLDQVTEPKVKAWKGAGLNPVCLMRTSWSDPNAIFLGFKAGSPSVHDVNHGHMDVGSFVLDADGVRWASDLGMQGYASLESKNLKIWDRQQDSQRWQVFRYNNRAHNTLTIDNQLQRVFGSAKLEYFSDQPNFMTAVSDLSQVYETQLAGVKRGVAIIDQKFVVVRDELVATDKPATVRWSMLTTATPQLASDHIILTQGGKTLTLKVNCSSPFVLKIWSTEPTTDYDDPNPGTVLVGFELQLSPHQKQAVDVALIPGSAGECQIDFSSLATVMAGIPFNIQ
jgi:hypothetical protein